jgi:hypothetical protein
MKPFSTLLIASLCALCPAWATADEIYREDFTDNGVVSKVGWSVWHKDETSGLVIDDTAKSTGDRAAVFTSYAGKPISHVYSSINSNNGPTLLFTTEFTLDLNIGSISSFNVGRFMDGDPLDKLQLALRVDSTWYVYVPQIIDDSNSGNYATTNSMAPATVITFSSSNWMPITYSIGAAPSEGTAGILPTGYIDGIGFYMKAFNSSNPGAGTTRERIDYLTVNGTAPVPEPATCGLIFGSAGLLAAVALRRRKAR